jgi:hypothetical protein
MQRQAPSGLERTVTSAETQDRKKSGNKPAQSRQKVRFLIGGGLGASKYHERLTFPGNPQHRDAVFARLIRDRADAEAGPGNRSKSLLGEANATGSNAFNPASGPADRRGAHGKPTLYECVSGAIPIRQNRRLL